MRLPRVPSSLLVIYSLLSVSSLFAGSHELLPEAGIYPENRKAQFGISKDGSAYLKTRGKVDWKITIEQAGTYGITAVLSGDKALGILPKFEIWVNEEKMADSVSLKTEKKTNYSAQVKLPAGEVTLGIMFVNDAYRPDQYDRNLYVHKVIVAEKE